MTKSSIRAANFLNTKVQMEKGRNSGEEQLTERGIDGRKGVAGLLPGRKVLD